MVIFKMIYTTAIKFIIKRNAQMSMKYIFLTFLYFILFHFINFFVGVGRGGDGTIMLGFNLKNLSQVLLGKVIQTMPNIYEIFYFYFTEKNMPDLLI